MKRCLPELLPWPVSSRSTQCAYGGAKVSRAAHVRDDVQAGRDACLNVYRSSTSSSGSKRDQLGSSRIWPDVAHFPKQIEQERVSAAPAVTPPADGRQRTREGVFLRRDSMIAAHDGLISRSRSFAPDRHDSPSAQYAAMEGEKFTRTYARGCCAMLCPAVLHLKEAVEGHGEPCRPLGDCLCV